MEIFREGCAKGGFTFYCSFHWARDIFIVIILFFCGGGGWRIFFVSRRHTHCRPILLPCLKVLEGSTVGQRIRRRGHHSVGGHRWIRRHRCRLRLLPDQQRRQSYGRSAVRGQRCRGRVHHLPDRQELPDRRDQWPALHDTGLEPGRHQDCREVGSAEARRVAALLHQVRLWQRPLVEGLLHSFAQFRNILNDMHGSQCWK